MQFTVLLAGDFYMHMKEIVLEYFSIYMYSYVNEKNGGPYSMLHDQDGEMYYRLNSNWADCRINLKVMRCKDCNWQNPLAGKKLYEGFIENTQRVKEILEG